MTSSTYSEIASKALTTAAVIGFLALCRKFASTPRKDFDAAATANVRIPSMVAVNVAMLVVAVVLAFAIRGALVAANHFMATRPHNIELVVYPSTTIWWFLPGFASICLIWEITYQIWRAFDPQRADAYRAYSNVKSGMNSTAILRWMAFGLVLPIAIATILAIPSHTTLTQTGIYDGHFASLKDHVYLYSSATQLIQFDGSLARDQSFYSRAGVIVKFRNGETWNSADSEDAKITVDPQLISLLVQHTHLSPEHTHIQP